MDEKKILESEQKNTRPWVEKYRPVTLSDITDHEDTLKLLKGFHESEQGLPHLMFYGPAGNGKTSTALVISKWHDPFNVLELNASDDRGIDVVRGPLKAFTSHRTRPGMKLIILDEADRMTPDAQRALRRFMEQYSNVARIIMICNEKNNMIDAICSRCLMIAFRPLHPRFIKKKMVEVLQKEALEMSETAQDTLCQASDGDMRACLNVLQTLGENSVVSREGATCVIDKDVLQLTGQLTLTEKKMLIKNLLELSVSEVFHFLCKWLLETGHTLLAIVEQLTSHILEEKTLHDMLDVAGIFRGFSILEVRLALHSCSETIQLGYFVSLFKKHRKFESGENLLDPTLEDSEL